jgi:hypothetical protein
MVVQAALDLLVVVAGVPVHQEAPALVIMVVMVVMVLRHPLPGHL